VLSLSSRYNKVNKFDSSLWCSPIKLTEKTSSYLFIEGALGNKSMPPLK
jgi:hypothetical protein